MRLVIDSQRLALLPYSIVKERKKLIKNFLRKIRLSQVPNSGGGKRDRTADLLVANQTLSQLSYTPGTVIAGLTQRGHVHGFWWAWKDLNFRPHAYQACALTS